jgi:hypothetical protein
MNPIQFNFNSSQAVALAALKVGRPTARGRLVTPVRPGWDFVEPSLDGPFPALLLQPGLTSSASRPLVSQISVTNRISMRQEVKHGRYFRDKRHRIETPVLSASERKRMSMG